MPKTVAEQILQKHCEYEIKENEIILCDVDCLMASDTTAPLAIRAFEEMGGKRIAENTKLVLVIDHAAPPPTKTIADLHQLMRKFAKEQQCTLFDTGDGICHQVMMEQGLVKTGDLVLGADSHTCTYGAWGAFATGVGSTDLAGAMLTGRSWFKVPQTIRIDLTGEFNPGVYAKDLILYLVGKLGCNGANYKSIEFYGAPLDKMSLSEKLTICNMVVEMGAKAGFICDHSTGLMAEEGAVYAASYNINLNEFTAQIAMPHQVENVVDIKEAVGLKIDAAFLGSCTNARLDDLRIAADILRGRKIKESVRFLVVPASRKVLLEAMREGIIETLIEAGAALSVPGCALCVGTHCGVPGSGESVISTSNRNFKGRMGNNQANIYLASPATLAYAALYGEIRDPSKEGGK